MPGPEPRLHLPYRQWPPEDRVLWEQAMGSDDPFAEAAGARLAKASRHTYQLAWRRFLGFLALQEPTALELDLTERLTIDRVRAFVTQLAKTNMPTTVARLIFALYHAARVMVPERDWTWLSWTLANFAAERTAFYRHCGDGAEFSYGFGRGHDRQEILERPIFQRIPSRSPPQKWPKSS